MTFRTAIVAFALVVTTTTTASAQGNFQAIPTGGRSALTGHTGVAAGTDGAAAFMNPATLLGTDWLISASVNLVGGEYTRVHGIEDKGIAKLGFDVLPTTVCLFMTGPKLSKATTEQGRTRLGICFGSLERDKFDYVGHGDASTGKHQMQSIVRNWQRFILGPTAAVAITPRVTLGAMIAANFSTSNGLTTASAITPNGSAPLSTLSTAFDGNAFGLSATVGVVGREDPFAWGLAVQSADLTIFGDSHNAESYAIDGPNAIASTYTGSGGFHPMAPWRISAGLARRWRWGSLELDGSVGIPQGPAFEIASKGTRTTAVNGMVTSAPAEMNLSERPSGAVQVGVGGEVYVTPQLSVLGGLSTSAMLNPIPGGILPTRQTRFGVSLGVGSHGEGGDLLLGVDVSYEIGRTLATNVFDFPPHPETVAMEGLGVIFVLAGSTSLQTIQRGVKDLIRTPEKREQERIDESKEQRDQRKDMPPP